MGGGQQVSAAENTTKDTKSAKVADDVSSDALVFDRLEVVQAEQNPIEHPFIGPALFVRRFKQPRPPFTINLVTINLVTINLVTMDLDGTTAHAFG